MTSARQKFSKILQEWNKNRIKLWQENIPKIIVEIKGDGEFYFYLCSLGT
jgi:hypothetical protein